MLHELDHNPVLLCVFYVKRSLVKGTLPYSLLPELVHALGANGVLVHADHDGLAILEIIGKSTNAAGFQLLSFLLDVFSDCFESI